MKANNILELIGNTPHIRMKNLFGDKAEVWLKSERSNPGGSIKDRIALSMIEDAEQRGIINKDTLIVEPTSGNTGIGLAMVCAVKKYQLTLVMPEQMSIERRRIMAAYGARFELTQRELGMKGAIERAKAIVSSHPNAWMPMQFDNPANTKIHRETTAQEIFNDFPSGIDYLITGVGTGGHITGCAEILKEKWPQLKVFAVEPELSPVLSGGQPGPHPIQGIGAGFIPNIMRTDILDGTIQVSKEDAFKYTVCAAKDEGLFIGMSSGAALAAVAKKLPEIPEGSVVMTFCYDTGERYLSISELFEV